MPTGTPGYVGQAIAPASAAFRPSSSYSSPELLEASDAIFGLLDDPAGHCGNELLAQYEAICGELSRRELFESAGGRRPEAELLRQRNKGRGTSCPAPSKCA